MEMLVKNRELVVPGDLLAKGDYLLGEGTYRQGENVHSSLLGLVDAKDQFIKTIPLSGKYVPKPRDLVIGVVTDLAFSLWYVDLNSPFSGVLTVANGTERYIDLNEEDISQIYGIGDVIVAKVENVSKSMVVGLTMKDRGLFKVNDGRLIEISPPKVPRVIGKKGTMVQLLKDLTGAKITVGQNGRVWISGGNTDLAIEAVRLIEREAHTQGLTDKVRTFLEEKTGKKSTAPAAPKPVAATPAPAAPAAPTPAPKPVEPAATPTPTPVSQPSAETPNTVVVGESKSAQPIIVNGEKPATIELKPRPVDSTEVA